MAFAPPVRYSFALPDVAAVVTNSRRLAPRYVEPLAGFRYFGGGAPGIGPKNLLDFATYWVSISLYALLKGTRGVLSPRCAERTTALNILVFICLALKPDL